MTVPPMMSSGPIHTACHDLCSRVLMGLRREQRGRQNGVGWMANSAGHASAVHAVPAQAQDRWVCPATHRRKMTRPGGYMGRGWPIRVLHDIVRQQQQQQHR